MCKYRVSDVKALIELPEAKRPFILIRRDLCDDFPKVGTQNVAVDLSAESRPSITFKENSIYLNVTINGKVHAVDIPIGAIAALGTDLDEFVAGWKANDRAKVEHAKVTKKELTQSRMKALGLKVVK